MGPISDDGVTITMKEGRKTKETTLSTKQLVIMSREKESSCDRSFKYIIRVIVSGTDSNLRRYNSIKN